MRGNARMSGSNGGDLREREMKSAWKCENELQRWWGLERERERERERETLKYREKLTTNQQQPPGRIKYQSSSLGRHTQSSHVSTQVSG